MEQPCGCIVADGDVKKLCISCGGAAEACAILGRATFYLADEYPGIKSDVYRKMPERRACEIILACKDLVDLTNFA